MKSQNIDDDLKNDINEKEQVSAEGDCPEAQDAAANQTPEDEQVSPERLAELCKIKICPLCSVQQEADDAKLRAMAEMENFKKRLQREHEEQIRFSAEKILSDILPSLDNLDLALQYGAKNEACKDMFMGIEMTRKLLLDALTKHGLSLVGVEGEEFSPEIHEAIGMEKREGFADNSVSRVMQRGYKLKDRLLRPAKVMIN